MLHHNYRAQPIVTHSGYNRTYLYRLENKPLCLYLYCKPLFSLCLQLLHNLKQKLNRRNSILLLHSFSHFYLEMVFIKSSRNPSNPKDWCQDSWGAGSVSSLSLPVKIIITYLIRVFDTTWESKFWALKFLFLGQFFIFSYGFEGHSGIWPSPKSFSIISFTVFAERGVSKMVTNIYYIHISSRFIYSKILSPFITHQRAFNLTIYCL